jgi:hypothetical protein
MLERFSDGSRRIVDFNAELADGAVPIRETTTTRTRRILIMKNSEVTIERLERALIIAAQCVAMDGAVAVPLFERIERELAIARGTQDAIDRAKELLASLARSSSPPR